MASKAAIFSMALIAMGKAAITDPDAGADPQDTLNVFYPTSRDLVLSLHPWAETIRYAQIGTGTKPAACWRWANAFDLPKTPKCLRVIDTDLGDGVPFAEEGGQLLTDGAGPVRIAFIAQITDETLFSAGLAQTIAANLAAETVYKLTAGSQTLVRTVQDAWEAKRRWVTNLDSKRSRREQPENADGWKSARM